MTFLGWLTIFGFAVILTALALPLGRYMAAVYTNERTFLTPVFGWLERLLYRAIRVDASKGQDWKAYARGVSCSRSRAGCCCISSCGRRRCGTGRG